MTVHVIMVHGPDIIRTLPFPPGLATEEGAESTNRKIRETRDHHSRRNSAKNNLHDIFLRITRSSDPLILKQISDPIIRRRKRMPITPEVASVLLEPVVEFSDVEMSSAQSDIDTEQTETDGASGW